MKRFILFLAVLLTVLSGLSSCRRSAYHQFTGFAQGGVWQVKCDLSAVSVSQEDVQQQLDSLLSAIDMSLSGYNKNSILSRHRRGENPPYDSLFLQMLSLSEKSFRLCEGKVDASASRLFDAWGFGFSCDSLPSDEQLRPLMARRASFSLTAADGTPQEFNFNALAQGYSCDVLAAYLRSIGVCNMMVNVGGEMYSSGVNPSGRAWTFGIDTPYDGNQQSGASLIRVFSVGEGPCGVVTSGNYRKFYVKDGVKYSHTIDPTTGYPVCHSLLSATLVVNPSCSLILPGGDFENYPATLADALATYCMVVGFEKAKAFVTSHPGIEACLIYGEQDAMQQWCSEGFLSER